MITFAGNLGKHLRCARGCAGDRGAGVYLSFISLTLNLNVRLTLVAKYQIVQASLPDLQGVVQEIEEQVHHSLLHLLYYNIHNVSKVS